MVLVLTYKINYIKNCFIIINNVIIILYMKKQTIIRTTREKEMNIEFKKTIEKLETVSKDDKYFEQCKGKHNTLIRSLIKSPYTTYNSLIDNLKNPTIHLEAVVLNLLRKIFDINTRETRKFNEQYEILSEQPENDIKNIALENLVKDETQYTALFEQCIIKVSHIFFKSRYNLSYRPTIETIADMLTFIDIMCRTNKCRGYENPYFHSRRYLYYLKYMLDQYEKGHIIIPTYRPIGATDFIKIRCVPVYILGCNIESDYADEYYNTPLEFFAHDVQHARRQLYYTEQKLYNLNNLNERFANNSISRSVFDINNNIVLENYDTEFMKFIKLMADNTKDNLCPLIVADNEIVSYLPPLNFYTDRINIDVAKGLKSIRKMILFEVLHEAALTPLNDEIINSILMSTHTTPIERVNDNDPESIYPNIQNIIYPDPTTLSNVLYKIKGTFFDRHDERAEYIAPVNYRTPEIIALAALQIITRLSSEEISDYNSLFNKLLHLTLNRTNRLQSTTKIAIDALSDSTRFFRIDDIIGRDGNVIPIHFEQVNTTRMAIKDDPVFQECGCQFYGPDSSDQSVKIGLFGGTFDPPHNCHKLRIAKLYMANSLDKVVISVALNSERKSDASTIDSRYSWTFMMLEEILKENNDPNLISFRENPGKNNSKFELIHGSKGAGDTIINVRKTYPGSQIIFIYGSDYLLKKGNLTPLDDFDKPETWQFPGNFYHTISQIQFLRSDKTCNASSTKIKKVINKFIDDNDVSILSSYSNDLPHDSLPEIQKRMIFSLIPVARELEMSVNILISYINYRTTHSKSGGFNKYYIKYLKYKNKYLDLKNNLSVLKY